MPRAPRPLNILLTNDDGWRGPGGATTPYIVAVRDALRAAGHHVVVVAPGTDQSGQGGRVSSRGEKLRVAGPEKDVWTVTPGSPSDSVYFGMDEIFPHGKPDLVVSGINPGFNFGALVNHSGTVNAALTGVEFGVPALAMSLETQPDWPEGTELAAAPAAAYVVDLVRHLEARARDGRLMPRGVALNVNYPLVQGPADPDTGSHRLADPKGTRATTVQGGAFLVPDFTPDDGASGRPGTYTMGYGAVDTSADAGSDIRAIAEDYVSVSALQDDHDVDGRTEGWVRALARGMR
ncbi:MULTISPECIES: 5'/3'-nucleotidase SurE [unclassified Streptomyces]|uniref:5'/3'-nucleotidase SurE n=1 Tax=unclassified Streptomyces TaxID=2593676 RepID=UPI00278BAFE1|nr:MULTISPECIES: 5'/3'-nucleotidase SurE [unclassified Streptomyces]